jgi:uncharacterized protein (TIGR03790 family)
LIRLAGTSIGAQALAADAAKDDPQGTERLRNQALYKWHALLRNELDKSAFRGVLPEEAAETASAVRFVAGVMGELRFWQELQTTYAKKESSASVDSELTFVLEEPYQLAKWLPNPFHDRYEKIPYIQEIRRSRVMVGRLDGPTPEDAKRMVDDALHTEKKGLWGRFYIDSRGLEKGGAYGSYSWYDGHLVNLYHMVKDKSPLTVIIDETQALFPQGSCPDAALYCGWYSLGNYVDAFQWRKGAVGYHIASAEASTLRTPTSNVWCKRMIENGVAATLGPVEEPYLLSFPLPDHFFPALMTGKWPLLEVYFKTVPFISWRQTLIGDPLYTPFKSNPVLSDFEPSAGPRVDKD